MFAGLVVVGCVATLAFSGRMVSLATNGGKHWSPALASVALAPKDSACSCPPALAIWQCTQEEHTLISKGIGCPYYKGLTALTQQSFTCTCPPALALWSCTRKEYAAIMSGSNCPYYSKLANPTGASKNDVDVYRMYLAQVNYASCVGNFEDRHGAPTFATCCPRHWNTEWGVGPVCHSCSEEALGGLMCCPKMWKQQWGVGPQCQLCPRSDDGPQAKAVCLPALLVEHKECVESVHARQALGETIASAICRIHA